MVHAEREPQLVDTKDALVALARTFASAESVALDAEGDGLYRYRARLCTLQLATAEHLAIVDTLALRDLSPLASLLGPDGPRKILHDAAFDARLLREQGVPLERVLDTAVCARFLGEPAQGLASLLEKYFGILLPKDRQRADWGVRPIDADAMRYLAGDVLHLHALADALLGAAGERGIVAEIDEECLYVLSRAADEAPPTPPPWTRVKGALELVPMGRAILRELCLVRELEAQRRDVPPFKVLGNEALLAIARRRPHTRHDLRNVGGEVAVRHIEFAEQLVDGIRRGEAVGDVPAEDLRAGQSRPLSERNAVRAREKALQNWRRTIAAERAVDAQVVLPGHCLAQLAEHDADSVEALAAVRGIGAMRVARDSDALLALLRDVRAQPVGPEVIALAPAPDELGLSAAPDARVKAADEP